MMVRQQQKQKRKGSVLVEYALLIAGIVLASVVGIAVLGHKTSDQFALMAVIMPGAHLDDNQPISASNTLPFTLGANGGLVIDNTALVAGNGGLDRTANLIGAGGATSLIIDQ